VIELKWNIRNAKLQTPTKLSKKESARLDKNSDLQGVLKDFTDISAFSMKI
jgi:hypothetical protein